MTSPTPSTDQAPRGAAPTVAVAILSTATGALPAFLLGGVAVQVRADLDFGEARLGLAVTLFFAVSALASTPAGRLTERIGIRRAMTVTAVVAAVALVTVATATSWWVLAAALVVAAVGNAFSQPAANLLLSRVVARRRQGVAFGLKQAAVPLTSLLGGLAVPTVALTLGWRWAFVAGAVVAVALLAVAPRDARSGVPASDGTRATIDPGARRSLLVLSVGAALANMGSNSLGVFLVESLVARGTGEAVAGLALVAGSAIAVVSRITIGWWADRTRRQLYAVVATLMVVGSLGHLLLATGLMAAVPVAILLAFGAGWGWNGLFAYSVVATNPTAPATATGLTQSGLFFGAMAGPGLAGVLVELAGHEVAWSVLAALLAVGGACTVVGNRLHQAHLGARRAEVGS